MVLFAVRIKEIDDQLSGKRKEERPVDLLTERDELKEKLKSRVYEDDLYDDIDDLEKLGKLHYRVGFVRIIIISSSSSLVFADMQEA